MALQHALLASAGEFVTWALVGLIGDADIGGDPPAARAGAAIQRSKVDAGTQLHGAGLALCNRPADDLTVDQLNSLFLFLGLVVTKGMT